MRAAAAGARAPPPAPGPRGAAAHFMPGLARPFRGEGGRGAGRPGPARPGAGLHLRAGRGGRRSRFPPKGLWRHPAASPGPARRGAVAPVPAHPAAAGAPPREAGGAAGAIPAPALGTAAGAGGSELGGADRKRAAPGGDTVASRGSATAALLCVPPHERRSPPHRSLFPSLRAGDFSTPRRFGFEGVTGTS